MAARFYGKDTGVVNHFYNFGTNDPDKYYKSIAEKILKEELSLELGSTQDMISSQDKFKKLLVLFRYRDIKKYKKRKLKLYIKNKKVSKTLSINGAKRASDTLSLDNKLEQFYSKELYYFIISSLTVSGEDSAEVRVDITDSDFLISNSTKDKYIDYL
jgi:hypothetical protein